MKRWTSLIALTIVLVYGCGSVNENELSDAGTDVVIGEDANIDIGISKGDYAFVVNAAPDYSSGSFSILDMSSKSVEKNRGIIHSDAVARVYGNLVYVVNRMGADNITIIDPASNYSIVKQFSVGSGMNPQDVVVSGDKIFVTLQLSNKIPIYDHKTYEKISEIDTSEYADADGSSEPGEMVLAGDKLYISILRLDKNNYYSPTDKSYIIIVNTSTKKIEKDLQLGATNPFAGMVFDKDNDRIIIGETGSFTLQDGRIEFLDTKGDIITQQIIPESEWGGDLNKIAYAKNKILAIVSDENFNTVLKAYDLVSSKIETVYSTTGFNLSGINIYNESEIYLCDRTKESPGVRIFDLMRLSQKGTEPIDTGLPPVSLVFFSR